MNEEIHTSGLFQINRQAMHLVDADESQKDLLPRSSCLAFSGTTTSLATMANRLKLDINRLPSSPPLRFHI